MRRRHVAVDLETTGLNSVQDRIIEVGIVGEDTSFQEFSRTFSLPFPEHLMSEEARAINGYGQRVFPEEITPARSIGYLADVLRDAHIVGKNPYFDESFLATLFAMHGVEKTWHYRMVDVGALAWGYYNGKREGNVFQAKPPNVERVEDLVGIYRQRDGDFHTALDDARWAWRVFRHIVPLP